MTPDPYIRSIVTRQIVPDEYQANWRPSETFGRFVGIAPIAPVATPLLGLLVGEFGQSVEDLAQLLLQPRMQNRIGRTLHRKRTHLPRRRVKEGEQLGGSAPDILMGPVGRIGLGLPGRSRLRDGLIGTSFVFVPEGNACLLC